ncbi:hypothetical protein P13BB106kb_p039 [Pectobacterium phage DU_PP_V]|uniref:Uncharacterized protein n=1 Tax=Pectobacterium phage DU_PP_V TaxID=2041492 RepID=A0A2D2W727_9CAUD|nr:hypothetical protein HOS40_gp039 [Pectobacterium phage DU_PP_V]ATS94023.1 hypothetical protein P13BB106kb_p039 [Pectobacterium phage DU_PP_V]
MLRWLKNWWVGVLNYWADIPKEHVQRSSISGKPLLIFYDRTLNHGWKLENTDYSKQGSIYRFSIELNPIKDFDKLISAFEGKLDDYLEYSDMIKLENLAYKLLDNSGVKVCLDTTVVPFKSKKFKLTSEELLTLRNTLENYYNKKKN